MGKTFRRNESYRPKGGKDFSKFKKSNKFKKWKEKPHHALPSVEPVKDVETDEIFHD